MSNMLNNIFTVLFIANLLATVYSSVVIANIYMKTMYVRMRQFQPYTPAHMA